VIEVWTEERKVSHYEFASSRLTVWWSSVSEGRKWVEARLVAHVGDAGVMGDHVQFRMSRVQWIRDTKEPMWMTRLEDGTPVIAERRLAERVTAHAYHDEVWTQQSMRPCRCGIQVESDEIRRLWLVPENATPLPLGDEV
jgi:hypothetical protein